MKEKHRVCPVEKSGQLDNWFRKVIHNPKRILRRYVQKDMTVLDIGCGPGLFSFEMAQIGAKVIAADLQQEMLDKLKNKIKGLKIEKRIKLVKSDEDNINVNEKVDFVLVFYVVHEVKDKKRFFKQIKEILKKSGKILIIEPIFHVSNKKFRKEIEAAENIGFKVIKRPKIALSKAIVLENN